MASKLQQQLAKIAANSTHQLDLKAQKAAHSKSLLFDRKVAASQDLNTIYRICIEGFRELCTLDARYNTFASTLFSEQSRSEERERMNEEENRQLDTWVDSFLVLVSGRLLLKPAQKAVEWLVRRFRIQEHNTQALLLAFLPYHATPLFLSLLDILPKQLPHTFRFLYPSISTMENPPFHTILHAAIHNPPFFTTYGNFILQACRSRYQASAVMTFWLGLAAQAVDGMISTARSGRDTVRKQKQEELMLRVLPILNEALSPKLADVHDLVIAACTIIMVLAAQAHLEDHVLDSMIEAVVLKSTPATIEARATAILVISEQRDALEFSKSVTKKLLKNDAIFEQLLLSSQTWQAGRIFLGLILRDLKGREKTDGYLTIDQLKKLLQQHTLPETHEAALCERMVSMMGDQDRPISEAQREAVAAIVESMAMSPQSNTRLQAEMAKANVSQDTIESALQTTLLLTNGSAEPDADGDERMDDVPTHDPFERTISMLEKHTLTNPSFLAMGASEDFALFRAAFEKAVHSEAQLQNLLQLPNLAGSDEPLSVPVLTFILRLAFDTSLAGSSRATAARCLLHLVKLKSEPCAHLQFLVPYLIAALADSFNAVRQASAEAIVAVAECYNSEHKQKVRSESEIHRETYPWEVLSHDVMQQLLDTILVPKLEEAALDANAIITTLTSALILPKESKKEKKKTKPNPASNASNQICEYLAFHAGGTTLVGAKLALLRIVNGVRATAAHAQETVLVPALTAAVASDVQVVDEHTVGVTRLGELQSELWRAVTPHGTAGIDLLTRVIAGQVVGASHAMVAYGFKRAAEIWKFFPEETGKRVANIMVDAALSNLDTNEPELYRNLSNEAIRSVPLPGYVLSMLIDSLPNSVNLPDASPATKRRRTSRSEKARLSAIEPSDLAAALTKYSRVLELVENNKPAEHPELLSGMFKVLEELQNFRLQTQSGLTYIQGLVMSCILAIVDKQKTEKESKLDLSSIRTDLIVDCIRHTSSAQVQSTALLLISSLASWQPDIVVNSIMPIFTFMGTTILRQGDEYSAHVTEQTISRVVPPLVESFRKKNKDIVIGASSLLLSFTAAFEHIPLHRRLALFEHLSRTIGAEDCLYALIAMLTDAYPTDERTKRFVAELLNKFEPSTSLKTIKKCLDLVWDMFRPRRTLSNHILNLPERPKDTHDNIALNLLGAFTELLHDKRLRAQMSRSFESGDIDSANAQRTACVELIQEAIRLNQFLKQKPDLVQAGADMLSAIVGLLPTMELVQCSETLLAQKDEEVKLVAIGSVVSRAKEVVNPSSDDVVSLLGFMKNLTALVATTESVPITVQAIECAGQIIKRFGKKDTELVIDVVQAIAAKTTLQHADRQVQLASVVCLTLAMRVLKDEFIPMVPTVLPVVFAYLDETLAAEPHSKSLSLCRTCFAYVHSLVEHLPFLATGENLDRMMQLLAKGADVSKLKENRGALWRLIAKNVDADEVFGALERNHDAIAGLRSLQASIEMFSSLRLAITSHQKSIIIRNASTLFELFLKAFDQSRVAQSSDNEEEQLDGEEVAQLQSICQEVALVMVMKLNDVTFRPFVVMLAEWANQLPRKDQTGRMLRATSMFSFLAALSAKFKGLVTSYATYSLELAADILSRTNPSEDVQVELLRAVLSALSESFEHDNEEFWQAPHHFTPIATPLISLLEKCATTSSDADFVIPKLQSSIFMLAQATSAQDQHKAINSALLKMMRHEDAKVRLVSVRTERELCERMGDEWLGMLPEMLPFVAELLEDDDKEVERAGREWIRYLEGVLGENLDLS